MYKKNLLKATSVFTAFALACTSMTGCGLWGKKDAAENIDATEAETVENEEADELVETMTKTAYTGSSEDAESGKEETVYVMTDANGSVNDVVVSNWLKNSDGSQTLTDTTSLKDIVNVKGDETYTDNGDGTVTWNASGQDIYYQGTPTSEVPVGVKVTYMMDGKEMSPEEIAGKSGKVTIRFDYTNTLEEKVTIDGEETQVKVPFTMISGTMLDNTKFSNVKVSSGKVISDANNYVVVGVAMPGLKESLKLDDNKLKDADIDEDEVDLPDYVEVTANVTEFELPMTISMASANVISDLGLDKIYNAKQINTLNDDMDELSDASTQLVDGSGKLADGTGEFKDGTGKLADGTKDLVDGTKDLKDGTGKLRDGAGQLANGSGTLADGANTLSSGVKTYTDAVSTLASGTVTLDDGVGKLAGGAGSMVKGLKSAKDGSKSLKDGANKLSAGITTAADGVSQKLSAATLAKNTFATDCAFVINYASQQAGSLASGASVATLNASMGSANDLNSIVTDISFKLSELTAASAQMNMDDEEEAATKKNKKKNQEENTDEATPADEETPDNSADTDTVEPENNDNSGNNDSQNDENQTPDQSQDNSSNDADSSASTDDNSSDNASDDSNADSSADNSDSADAADSTSDESGEGASEDDGEEAAEGSAEVGDSITLNASGDEGDQSDVEYGSDEGWAVVTELTGVDASKWQSMNAYAENALKTSASDMQQLNTVKAGLDGAFAKAMGGDTAGACAICAQLAQSLPSDPALTPVATKLAAGDPYPFMIAVYSKLLTQAVDGITKSQTAATYATTIYMTYQTLTTTETTLNTLYNGTGNGGLKDIKDGAQKLATGADQLDSGLSKLYKGSKDLNKGLGTLHDGTGKLKDGANLLSSNSGALTDGAGKLASGALELSNGATELSNGTVELDDGVGSLQDGVGKLNDGATELNDGATELDDGAKKLADGMVEFDEEGIQKLTTTVDDDLLSVTDRLKAVDEASQSFKTFSGANETEPSSVQFIIRTEGITID